MNLRFFIVFFHISDTMVSNDPWSPLAGGQDPSTVLGGNDAWGEPAAAVKNALQFFTQRDFNCGSRLHAGTARSQRRKC